MIWLDAILVRVRKGYNGLPEDLQVYRIVESSKFKIEELEVGEDTRRINVENWEKVNVLDDKY